MTAAVLGAALPLLLVVVATRSTAFLEWLSTDPRPPMVAVVHAMFAFAMAGVLIVTARRLGMGQALMLAPSPRPYLLIAAGWGLGLGALPTLLALLLIGPQPAVKPSSQILIDFLPTVIAVPLIEELMFRGVLLGWLTRFIGFVGATILTTLMFAAIHTGGSVIAALLTGLVMCWLIRRTGSLLSSLTLHSTHNLTVLVLAAVPLGGRPA